MSNTTYQVPAEFKTQANIDATTYDAWYQASIESPETFWADQAMRTLEWEQTWSKVCDADLTTGTISWFKDAKLNVTHNTIDRHLPQRAQQTAIIWEGDDPNDSQLITYQELHDSVCQLANALQAQGVSKGDRVCIYMPMVPEAAYAMLACARIGAVHSVVFGGFSPTALKDRIIDADAKIVITADEGRRGGKTIPLKANTDQAVQQCPDVKRVIVVRVTSGAIDWHPSTDVWYQDIIKNQPQEFTPVSMDAEDPLFILYTSGSTGQPKGVLHTTAGYLLQATMTHKYVLDHREGDIYWCTADVGWITGHSYIIYGPLANGATTLMFEGVPNYPSVSRCWEICDKYKVTTFYTAPTAIRALMSHGNDPVNTTSRASLRLLGSVGEPINPEAWEWYYKVVGNERCPIVDTWWQTETGAIMISTIPGAHAMKPGAAGRPFFGVKPVILNPEGEELTGAAEGLLAIQQTWPSQIRSVYNNHQRCIETYYAPFKNYYFSGDGAKRDTDGYYWITGRVDDVLNVSGHRLGTAEIESAFVQHPQVAEAAVVGCPHDIKGQGIYAFVTLMHGETTSDALKKELTQHIAKIIGPIAKPDHIQWASALPKTRSGKIMRRILRKIGSNQCDALGDTSTLADASVVDELIQGRIV